MKTVRHKFITYTPWTLSEDVLSLNINLFVLSKTKHKLDNIKRAIGIERLLLAMEAIDGKSI